MLSTDAYLWILLPICGIAVAGLALALTFGLPSLIPWPLVLLAGAYAARLADAHVDEWAPVYAGAFFSVAELAYWSLELRGQAQEAERLTERRAGMIIGLALGAVALGGFVLAATSIPIGSGVAADLLGVVAAVLAIALVAVVARPRRT